jgi:hypothetical protein
MDLDRQTNHGADAKSERSTHAGTGVNEGVDSKRFGGCPFSVELRRRDLFPRNQYLCLFYPPM